jgi:nitric oxide reductase large subunit
LPRRKWLSQTAELIVLVFAVLRTNVEDVLIGGFMINCALSVYLLHGQLGEMNTHCRSVQRSA